MGQITKNDLPTELSEYIDALEDRVEELSTDVEKSDDAIAELLRENDSLRAGATAADLVEKSDDDDVFAAAISKADPQTAEVLKAQRTELQAAKAAIAKAEADTVQAVMVSKAAEIGNVYVEKTDDEGDEGMVTLLKSAYAVSDDFGDRLYEVFKHANHLIDQGSLFNELGSGGAQTVVAKSVEAQAAELRKSNPELTEADALAQIYANDPSLYEQAKQEG